MCWLWTGSTRSGGYGVFRVGDRSMAAHRFAWELAHGPIPAAAPGAQPAWQVTHLCGTKRCVRPDHLQLRCLKEETEGAGPRIPSAELPCLLRSSTAGD